MVKDVSLGLVLIVMEMLQAFLCMVGVGHRLVSLCLSYVKCLSALNFFHQEILHFLQNLNK